ncbi:MAG: sensor domain-containing diguanylate cyclase, partial [Bacillota bacterium]|nr:sensor domain-containing diguanylate cyclase [Bacillota bacterium]
DSKRIFISDIDIINEKTLAGIVINKRYSIKIDKYSEEWRKFIKSDIIFPDGKIFDQESIIYIPLTVGNEVIGTVTVQSRESYKFSDLDFEYLKALTGYISSAINNELKTEKLIILNNKLNNLTRIDDTTNLFNKRELNRVIKLELSRAIRNKTSIAVIIIDLDYFKEYNDFYGHLKCDEIIIVLANILKSVFKRSYDFVSRFGGDEFVILVSNVEKNSLKDLIEKLKKEIDLINIEHKKSSYNKITVSIGAVISHPDIEMTSEILLNQADKALYKVKNNKRNNYYIYEL